MLRNSELSRKSGLGLLGRRIFGRSLLLLLIVSGIAVLLQTLLYIDQAEDARRVELENFIDAIRPSLARAAWQVNEESIEVLLATLNSRPEVSMARFESELITLQIPKQSPDTIRSNIGQCPMPIRRDLSGWELNGNILPEGRLLACYIPDDIRSGLLFASLLASLPQLVAILLMASGFVLLIRTSVIIPIQALTRSLGEHSTEIATDLQRPGFDQGDEIEMLVNELKERSRRLDTERNIAQTAFESITDGMVVSTNDGLILRSNPAFDQMFAQHRQYATDRNLADFISPDLLYGEADINEYSTDEGKFLEIARASLSSDKGQIGYIFLIRDRTAWKRMETDALHAHKMNSIGTLSGGIAHDFNNLLSIILGNTELLLASEDVSSNDREMLRAILSAASRGAQLTDQLLTFARKQSLKSEPIKPESVVKTVVEMAKRTMGAKVVISCSVQSRFEINSDASYLETALLNLLVNARDAMPNGGKILLNVRDCVSNGRQKVVFMVGDNGAGIPTEQLDKVLDPFFTTKPVGVGTGLGLAMVSGFAEQSGGKLSIESTPGKGTTVTLVLPAVLPHDSTQSARLQQKLHQTGPAENNPSILLVDDDKAVRETVCHQLQALGYKVLACSSLSEVEQCISRRAEWSLVLCDVILQGHSGLDVLQYLRHQGVSCPIIFISGNVPAELALAIRRSDAVAVLNKPIMLRELQAEIDSAMSATTQAEQDSTRQIC